MLYEGSELCYTISGKNYFSELGLRLFSHSCDSELLGQQDPKVQKAKVFRPRGISWPLDRCARKERNTHVYVCLKDFFTK